MPADAELRVRAAVEQAISALRQVKGEVAGVRAESKTASASQASDASRNVQSTVKQREALLALSKEYGAVAASAKRGSEEQRVAARMSAQSQERANALVRETSTQTQKLGGHMNLLGKTMGIVFGGAIAAKGLEDIVNVAKEAQQSQVQLANTMKDAGQSYAANRKQIEGSIEAESKLAGVQRVELRTSFMNLDRLTGSVTKGIRDMGLATDIARARHLAMSQATKLVMLAELGRVAMLRRMGIALPTITTAEDKLRDSHAKVTAEVKRQAKEWDQQQTAIAAVAALHKAYAGSAESYGKTASGSVDRLRVSWQDFGIELGNKVTPVIASASSWLADEIDKLGKSKKAHEELKDATALVVGIYHEFLPVVKDAVEAVRDLVGWFSRHTTAAKIVAAAIVAVYTGMKIYAATVRVVTAVTKAWAAIQALINGEMTANPIGIVVVALAALVAGLILAYKHSKTFRDIVNETGHVAVEVFTKIKQVGGEVFGFLLKHWQLVLDSFGPLGFIATQVIIHFHDIVAAIEHPIAAVKELWAGIFTWLEKTAITVALKIVEPFSHLPSWLGGGWARDMKTNLQGALAGLESTASTQGAAIGTALGRSMQSAFTPYLTSLTGAATGAGGGGGSPNTTGGSYAGRMSFGQAQIVTAARSQVGIPYRTGAGRGWKLGQPTDCSGLIRNVYAANGIQIPATSQTQWKGGRAVSGPLEPGDLIFYNNHLNEAAGQPGHVTMYLGGGLMIEDPHTGGHVQVVPVRSDGYMGARRYLPASEGAVPNTGGKKGGGKAPATTPDTAPSSQPWATGAGSAVPDAVATAVAGAAGGKKKTAKGLSAGSVATMRQAVEDLQAKISDILPAGLRDELEKRARMLIDGIRKGLSPAATASLRSDLKKLGHDVSSALTLDKAVETTRTSLAQIKQQIAAWPAAARRPLAAQMVALSKELSHVMTAADLAAAKRQLAQLKAAVTATITAAKKAVADARSVFEKEWQRFSDAALAAFDKVTQATIATHRITVQMAGYSFDYGAGDLTPAAQALQDLQDKVAQQGRDQAAAQAAADVQSKTSALQQLLALGVGGTDASGNVVSQSDIDQAKNDLAAAQQAVDQAGIDQREYDLQRQADAEQKAADGQLQTWTDAYQNTRDVQRQVLSDQLDDLKTAIEDQKATWNDAMAAIQGILSQGGSDAATAFWQAFNAAQAANVAAGGTNAQSGAQGAAGALGAAQGALGGTGGSGGDPGQGTSPNDRGGPAGVGGTAPSFVWGGIVWTKGDKAAFIQWLTSHGASYATWAANHPDAAAMLAKGGLVTSPTLAMLGEKPGGRGEGVIPLDDPRALAAIGQAIASAMPGLGGVTAVFPNAIVPGRDRDAARRLARMAGPELARVISYRTSP